MKSGYIIANQNEEFIASYQVNEAFTALSWTLSPAFAHVFNTRSECRKAMKAVISPKYDLWEMTIIETATQYIVGCSCSVLPPWYSPVKLTL